MKSIESIFFGDAEIPIESGLPRVEITPSTIRIINASKIINGANFLRGKIVMRKLEVDEDFSELIDATSFFDDNNYYSVIDFSGLKFPKVKNMTAMFQKTSNATGYPSEFPAVEYFGYPFRESNLKKFLFDLPKAQSIYCGADLCRNLETVDTNLPVCESCYHAFAGDPNLKTARIVSPRCVDFQTLFLDDIGLESVDILNSNSGSALARVQIDSVCINCTSLLTFSMADTSRVYSADNSFRNTPKLQTVSLSYPYLFTAKGMFQGSNLTSEQINAILESLPRHTTGTHIITFTGCPGASTCDATIATVKGWTVEI